MEFRFRFKTRFDNNESKGNKEKGSNMYQSIHKPFYLRQHFTCINHVSSLLKILLNALNGGKAMK